MNIIEAIEKMRAGARVRRRWDGAPTCWLEIGREVRVNGSYLDYPAESRIETGTDVIVLVAQVRKGRFWSTLSRPTFERLRWTPQQADVLATDYEVVP